MTDDRTFTFDPKEHEILARALKTLAGLESAKLPIEFSADRLAGIKALQARVA